MMITTMMMKKTVNSNKNTKSKNSHDLRYISKEIRGKI